MRSNLLLFKGKSKRISTTIGARAEVSSRKYETKEKTLRLSVFARTKKSTKKSSFVIFAKQIQRRKT
jgi:hypothetical protein